MKPTIEVTLNPDGTVKIEGKDFKGAACEKATAFLEEALGMSAAGRKKKPEYFQAEKAGTQQSIGK